MTGTPAWGDLATPGGTARVLREFGLHPRKRWGQHFLVSRRALDRILDAAGLGPQDTVLEIGAGLGTLTVALAARAGEVIAVEVDPDLLPALRVAVAPYARVTVVQGDILRLDLAGLLAGHGGGCKVVANLPYNVASPVVVSLLEPSLKIERLVLTVQREVAERLAAVPGTKDYGALTVAVRYRAEAEIIGRLPPTAFYPAPEVDSAIVRLQVRPQLALAATDEATFFQVVRAAFAQRRKTLRNTLAGGLGLPAGAVEAACRRAGIDPTRRGETLSMEEFAALTCEVAPRGKLPLSGKRTR